jgi:hypothetical protein
MMTQPGSHIASTRPALAAGIRAGLAGCAVALCLTAWIAASNEAMAQAAPPCKHDFSWSDPPALEPPSDICGTGDSAADFYALSWQIFKFLVWPASTQRGIPDTAKKITDAGPTTFESLKADWEIFRQNAEIPADWTAFPGSADPCNNHPNIEPGALVLANFNEFGDIAEGELGGKSVHMLVAQNRSYVRYQAFFNKKVFDTITGSRLYDSSAVGRVGDAPDGVPVPEATRQPAGALTVKSAWIELPGPNPIDPSRFYIRKRAWVQNPDNHQCRMADVGLVGLHIVYKSPSRPQWIWSTFEHVDNVPEPLPESNRSYTFNDGSSLAMKDGPDDDFKIPKPAGAAGPGDPPRPYQVQRLQPITADAADLNHVQQEKLKELGSVWRNYKLVMSQWTAIGMAPDHTADPLIPTPSCAGPNMSATANTTMETFFQAQPDCSFQLTCMGCHEGTRRTDSIWSIPFNRNSPSGMSRSGSRALAIKSLQDLLQVLRTK